MYFYMHSRLVHDTFSNTYLAGSTGMYCVVSDKKKKCILNFCFVFRILFNFWAAQRSQIEFHRFCKSLLINNIHKIEKTKQKFKVHLFIFRRCVHPLCTFRLMPSFVRTSLCISYRSAKRWNHTHSMCIINK